MARPIAGVEVTDEERAELERRIKAPTTSQRDGLRARIILKRARGIKQTEVAAHLGISTTSVNKWSQRFEREGLKGLEDRPGRGRPGSIPAEVVNRVITEATRPPKSKTRWSLRSMAVHAGISAACVRRIRQANDLKPHLIRTF